MGNTCQTECATTALELNICSVLETESAYPACEFAKTPRIEPLQSNMPAVKTHWRLPQLKLRKPGETHRESVAMNNVLAHPRSISSEGHFDDVCEAGPVGFGLQVLQSSTEALQDVAACEVAIVSHPLQNNGSTELPRLMLRRPGETQREQTAMANILVLPSDLPIRSASRSDYSMDSDDSSEAASILPASGDITASISGQPCDTTDLAGESALRAESDTDSMKLDSAGERSLEKTCRKDPPSNVGMQVETDQEKVAMTKLTAARPDMVSSPGSAATAAEVSDLQATFKNQCASMWLQTWMDSTDADEILSELAKNHFQSTSSGSKDADIAKPSTNSSVRKCSKDFPSLVSCEDHCASLLLHTWRDRADADEDALTVFAKSCARQALIELKEPEDILEHPCDQVTQVMLQKPCETNNDEVGCPTSAVVEAFTLPSETPKHMCVSLPTSPGSKKWEKHVDSSQQLRAYLSVGAEQSPQQDNVAAGRQLKLTTGKAAAQAPDLPAQSACPVHAGGKVKALAAMWETKQVVPSTQHQETNMAKPVLRKDNKCVARFWRGFPQDLASSCETRSKLCQQDGLFTNPLRKSMVPPAAGLDARLDASHKLAHGPGASLGARCIAQSRRQADLGGG